MNRAGGTLKAARRNSQLVGAPLRYLGMTSLTPLCCPPIIHPEHPDPRSTRIPEVKFISLPSRPRCLSDDGTRCLSVSMVDPLARRFTSLFVVSQQPTSRVALEILKVTLEHAKAMTARLRGTKVRDGPTICTLESAGRLRTTVERLCATMVESLASETSLDRGIGSLGN